jgi:TRAP-type C4-dicarboxylate transport system permease small subunit
MENSTVQKKLRNPWVITENTLSIISLSLIAILPAIEIVSRLFSSTGIRSSADYIYHLVIWITFAGGMITSRDGKHLSLSAGVDLIKQPYKTWIQSITSLIATAVTSALVFASYNLMSVGFESSYKIGLFPIKVVLIIMPLGFMVMAIRFIIQAPKGLLFKLIAAPF